MSRARPVGLLFVGALIASAACGIAIRRDLSAVRPGQVGYDDMCGLQEYFDALEIKTSPPPRLVSGTDLEGTHHGRKVQGGTERFAFENDFLLRHLRRVLDENWRRLPDAVATAPKIEVEVKWSERAGAKRVVTEEDAELIIGDRTFSLPYHPCLADLLYGEPLYRQRRTMWQLPLPGVPAARPPVTDGGAGAPDGGADGRHADAVSRSAP
jgi:hypothetical protein